MSVAKLFMNGRSQAVRLPKEYRFPGNEVAIRREGDKVILEPVKRKEWPRNFFARIRIADVSFGRAPQPRIPLIKPL